MHASAATEKDLYLTAKGFCLTSAFWMTVATFMGLLGATELIAPDITGGEARISDETMAVDFFSFDDLPPLSSARTNERHLTDIQRHLADPNHPTSFD